MQYLTYFKKSKTLPLAGLLVSILFSSLTYGLPIPASLQGKAVEYHQVKQINGWSCGYNTLYNACKLESSFGQHNPHADFDTFSRVCSPRLQKQGIDPRHGASNVTIESLAPHLGLKKWLSLRKEDYGVSPLISQRVSIPQGSTPAQTQQLIQQARQNSGQKRIDTLRQELDKAPLGKAHFAHFMCAVRSARGVPHAVLISVVKHANGEKKLYVCDNLNEPIHEDSLIKEHIDYLYKNFAVGSSSVSHQPRGKASHSKPMSKKQKTRQKTSQKTNHRQNSVKTTALRLKLVRAQQARSRRAQLKKQMVALQNLNKRKHQRTFRKRR